MLNSESEFEIGRSALSVGRFLMRSAIALPLAILSILFAPPASAAETKTILVLVDSLSQAFGLSPNEAYPMLLAKKLHAACLNLRVINASADGGATADGIDRHP